MNSRKEIPVLLLTGYLGSGKTTLLNKILANQKGIKFAVIVNDIGEVNIDAALIEQGGVVGKKDDSLVALQNGCICCTLKMDLVEQLKEIVDMQKFDYIVIEASGICEPAPIAQTICSIPTLGPQYVKNGVLRLDSIVTVVDALRMKDEFAGGDDLMKDNIDEEDLASLVIQQIEFCNIILLNKAAEVEPKDLDKLKHIIKAIQPKAEIFECNYGDVDLDKIVNTRKFDWETVATSAGWIQEIEAERNEDHHDHDDHDDDDDDDEYDDSFLYHSSDNSNANVAESEKTPEAPVMESEEILDEAVKEAAATKEEYKPEPVVEAEPIQEAAPVVEEPILEKQDEPTLVDEEPAQIVVDTPVEEEQPEEEVKPVEEEQPEEKAEPVEEEQQAVEEVEPASKIIILGRIYK